MQHTRAHARGGPRCPCQTATMKNPQLPNSSGAPRTTGNRELCPKQMPPHHTARDDMRDRVCLHQLKASAGTSNPPEPAGRLHSVEARAGSSKACSGLGNAPGTRDGCVCAQKYANVLKRGDLSKYHAPHTHAARAVDKHNLGFHERNPQAICTAEGIHTIKQELQALHRPRQ